MKTTYKLRWYDAVRNTQLNITLEADKSNKIMMLIEIVQMHTVFGFF